MAQQIFVVYRREDNAGFAYSIYTRLERSFGRDKLFMDIDLVPGERFDRVLSEAIANCQVVLAIIGPDWLNAQDRHGRRRIDQPNDWVRLELEAALGHRKTIIPVLINDTPCPSPEDLPKSLQEVVLFQAIRIRHEAFNKDVDELITSVRTALGTRKQSWLRNIFSVGQGDFGSKSSQGFSKKTSPLEPLPRPSEPEILRESDPVKLDEFIQSNPGSIHLALVISRLETILWAKAQGSQDTFLLKDFIKRFPTGVHAETAQKLMSQKRVSVETEIANLKRKLDLLKKEMDVIDDKDLSFSHDVFISYSKVDIGKIGQFADRLIKVGYKVWWDASLVSGDQFAETIRKELAASRAVVVVWTPSSVKSKWVKAEATMADLDDKLYPVRSEELDIRTIPLPFNVHHCEIVTEFDKVFAGLRGRGVVPGPKDAALAMFDDAL
jgi:hypothetical protein